MAKTPQFEVLRLLDANKRVYDSLQNVANTLMQSLVCRR
jgi:hypothetical protein